MKTASLLVVALLLASMAYAEPEPSLEYKISSWWDSTFGSLPFSFQSDYKSYVQWNPNFAACYYYTGTCDSITKLKVADALCTKKDGTKTYITLKEEDAGLAAKFCGTATQKGNGDIGASCSTSQDCGLACAGRTNCQALCIYSASKGSRICAAGDAGNSVYGGMYASVCASDRECETGQKCQNGLCTQPSYDSGNPQPVTTETIGKVVNTATKCADGTPVGQCSEKTTGLYCGPYKEKITVKPTGTNTQYELDPTHNSAALISWSSLCGCPEGQRSDGNGRTCCTPPNCLQCKPGEYQTKSCPGGEEIKITTCNSNGYFETTGAVCKIPEEDDNSAFWAMAAIAAITLTLAGAVILGIVALKKRR